MEELNYARALVYITLAAIGVLTGLGGFLCRYTWKISKGVAQRDHDIGEATKATQANAKAIGEITAVVKANADAISETNKNVALQGQRQEAHEKLCEEFREHVDNEFKAGSRHFTKIERSLGQIEGHLDGIKDAVAAKK